MEKIKIQTFSYFGKIHNRIPKGYRRLKKGEMTELRDLFPSSTGYWELIGSRNIPVPSQFCYIRLIDAHGTPVEFDSNHNTVIPDGYYKLAPGVIKEKGDLLALNYMKCYEGVNHTWSLSDVGLSSPIEKNDLTYIRNKSISAEYVGLNEIIIPKGYRQLKAGEIIWKGDKIQDHTKEWIELTACIGDTLSKYDRSVIIRKSGENKFVDMLHKPVEKNGRGQIIIPFGYTVIPFGENVIEGDLFTYIHISLNSWFKNSWFKSSGNFKLQQNNTFLHIRRTTIPISHTVTVDGIEVPLDDNQLEILRKTKEENAKYLFKKGDILIDTDSRDTGYEDGFGIFVANIDGDLRKDMTEGVRKATQEESELFKLIKRNNK